MRHEKKSLSQNLIIQELDDSDRFCFKHYGIIGSTNDIARELALSGASECTVITADGQTHGRGRSGRSFFSPQDTGIYMSVILRPKVAAEQALMITTAAAVAAAEAIEAATEIKADIKWVNDVYCDGKKVCGILTQSSLGEDGRLDFVLLGVGINVFSPDDGFPDDIKNKAAAICVGESDGLREKIIAEFLNRFMIYYDAFPQKLFFDAYCSRMFLAGQEVTVLRGGEERLAEVIGVSDSFGLNVRFKDGRQEILSSGEVSIQKI